MGQSTDTIKWTVGWWGRR